MHRNLMLSLSFSLPLLVGCGGGDTVERFPVSGSVSLDGTAIASGSIQFAPKDGKGPSDGAVIEDGKFEAKLTEGTKIVRISAPKVTGTRKAYDTPDSPTIDVTEEQVPQKYNSKSELEQDVKSGEENQFDFELKSK